MMMMMMMMMTICDGDATSSEECIPDEAHFFFLFFSLFFPINFIHQPTHNSKPTSSIGLNRQLTSTLRGWALPAAEVVRNGEEDCKKKEERMSEHELHDHARNEFNNH